MNDEEIATYVDDNICRKKMYYNNSIMDAKGISSKLLKVLLVHRSGIILF